MNNSIYLATLSVLIGTVLLIDGGPINVCEEANTNVKNKETDRFDNITDLLFEQVSTERIAKNLKYKHV